MTLQLTENECEALRWLFAKMLEGLKLTAAYSADRDVRRDFARRLEDIEAIEQLIRARGAREAA